MFDLSIPDDSKFVMIALNGSNCSSNDSNRAIDFSEELKVVFSSPIGLDEWITKQMGEVWRDRLRDSKFIIFAHAPYTDTFLLDDQNELYKNCNYLLHAFRISGPLHYNRGFYAAGRKSNGQTIIQDFYSILEAGPQRLPFKIDDEKVKQTSIIADHIYIIFTNKVQYQRLRRGMNCLFDAGTKSYLADQVHQYVRAIEALVWVINPGDFADRAKEFFSSSRCQHQKHVHPFFESVYKIRNCVEHFGELIDSPENREKALQVMFIASKIYEKVLSEKNLLECFLDDDSILSFRDMKSREKRQILGTLFDWNSMQEELSSLTTEY